MIVSLSLTLMDRLCNIREYVLAFLCLLFSTAVTAQAPVASDADVKMQQYNQRALTLLNNNKLDEAVPIIEKALAIKDNASSHYYLCHVYAVENEWSKSVKEGEKAISMQPDFLPAYSDLLYAYTKTGEWKKAEGIREQVKKSDNNGSTNEILKTLDSSLANETRAKIILALFFLALGAAFLYPLFSASKVNGDRLPLADGPRISNIILVSGSVCCLFWLMFEASTQLIWSFNPRMDAMLFTPTVRLFIFERDGIESFVLYGLSLGCMGVTLVLANLLLKLQNRSIYFGVFTVLFLVCAYYFYSIDFIPPMYAPGGEEGASKFPLIFGALAALCFGSYFLYKRLSIVIKIVMVFLIAYTTLVMILPSSLVDLSFILYPAMRMMYGAKIPDIYFQYDLLLSFIAFVWMKLNYSIETFPYLGQVSYFIFFVGIFFFSDRYFKAKWLSVLFILSLLIIRYYAIWEVGAGIFQVTPLRLDLWFIPLILAYRKGIHHWAVGLSLGLLIMLHRNLGIIYAGAYVELVLLLLVFDLVALRAKDQFTGAYIRDTFMNHVRLNVKNALMLVGSVALCFILFKEMFSPSALIYRQIGVGMIRISQFSFYWYVPVMMGCLAVILYRFRDKLGERYSVGGMFTLLLAVGNCMYFFGRSHENNIINISALLILAIFILFDSLIYLSPQKEAALPPPQKANNRKEANASVEKDKNSFLTKRTAYVSLPFLFVFISGYYYSDRLTEKCDIQYNNFKESQYVCPLLPMSMDTAAIRHITANSPNVFFLEFNTDFYYYYFGNYEPHGYFNPMESWIYKKDLLDFMQDLLNKHYYVVYNIRKYSGYTEYVTGLDYNHSRQENDMVAISKENASLLLPAGGLLHKAFTDTAAQNGLDFSQVDIKDNFSVEVIVKPIGLQSPNSTILNNFNRMNQLSGFTLQSSGSPGQYVFAYGSGAGMPSLVFALEDNKWHYLVVSVTKDAVKIYDNGKLVSNVGTGAAGYINSDIPLTIGNRATRDGHFNGYIREVKISQGNIDEATIAKNVQQTETALNTLR